MRRIREAMVCVALFSAAAACAALTPGEKHAIEGSVPLLCGLEGLIPVVGFAFAASCPEQEQFVANALDGIPDPGTTVTYTAPKHDAGVGDHPPPGTHVAVHRRIHGTLRCIGHGIMGSRVVKAAPAPATAASFPYSDASAPIDASPDAH